MDKLYNYKGALLSITDKSLLLSDIPADAKTVGKKIMMSDSNCKIIAHRGYHVSAAQNTIAAFEAAAAAGFTWIEIDIRRTADGRYVMSHDNAVTMYNNGSAVSVNIANANYSMIKDYTWDKAGQYRLCTLQAVFNAMKLYDMKMICDLKSGSNAEAMEIAVMCGAVDRVMLTYKSGDIDLMKKYDAVPVRIYPSSFETILTLQEQTVNPLYADMNVQGTDNVHMQNALAAGIPIIFSGCTLDNKAKWCVLASGCMANLNLNITYEQFVEALDVDYDVAATITPSAQSVSIASGASATLTAASDVSTPGGYVYGYTLDPRVATVMQTQFGASAGLTVNGVAAGSTVLRLFTGSGEIVDIPVTVN